MLKASGDLIRYFLLAPVVILITSCATSDLDPTIAPRRIDLAEFSSQSNTLQDPASIEEAVENPGASDSISRDPEMNPIRLGAGSPDIEEELLAAAEDFNERRESLSVVKPGERILIDSLVGHINGRPIFADEILLPIEDQLMALSRRSSSVEEFSEQAGLIISDRTIAVVKNELILSEAEASLTPEQQQGLLFFLRNLKEEEVAKRGGSRQEAERRLFEDEGISLEEKVELEKETVLIRSTMFQKIRSRVIVSWHDIEREYERNYDQFNPPRQVTISRIRLDSSNTEQVEDVKTRLAAGEDFGDIAQLVGMNKRGLWNTFIVGKDGVSDIPINDAYKPYLENLEEGQVTEAFETTRGRIMWLQVTKLTQPEGRSLYDQDVQEMLRRGIFDQRMVVERGRYMQKLLEKSTVDDLNLMANRIIEIALIRYSP
ncbi:MAG: hypothetical protein O7G85_07980 [Planctomycetota bacterium]|nr:hypothetical protein [Planctomycetota bacterium]